VTDASGDLGQQLRLQQPELCRPCGGTGSYGQLAVAQGHGLGVPSHFLTHQAGPLAEHLAVGQLGVPSTFDGQPRRQPAQLLGITLVGAGAGPAAPSWALLTKPTRRARTTIA
jgi:hypothetical protein